MRGPPNKPDRVLIPVLQKTAELGTRKASVYAAKRNLFVSSVLRVAYQRVPPLILRKLCRGSHSSLAIRCALFCVPSLLKGTLALTNPRGIILPRK
jgi:hypothetical protein